MNAPEFKPGDTVKLKSGGPIMTVQHIHGLGAHCVWLDDSRLNSGRFHILGLAYC